MFGITNNPKEYESALYCPSGRQLPKLISVEVVSERERQYSNLLQTLTTTKGSTIIKTSYAYDYRVGQEIRYRDGWWIIQNVREISTEINPVAMRLVKVPAGKRWAIELINVSVAPVAVVSHNANGGTGTLPLNIKASIGAKLALSSADLTKDGKAFNGWNTKADGSGTAYSATDSIVVCNMILYAQYEE